MLRAAVAPCELVQVGRSLVVVVQQQAVAVVHHIHPVVPHNTPPQAEEAHQDTCPMVPSRTSSCSAQALPAHLAPPFQIHPRIVLLLLSDQVHPGPDHHHHDHSLVYHHRRRTHRAHVRLGLSVHGPDQHPHEVYRRVFLCRRGRLECLQEPGAHPMRTGFLAFHPETTYTASYQTPRHSSSCRNIPET